MPQLIPLFPLPLVLLPTMPLPLHIFEDRYKEMIREIIADAEAGHKESEFGVVLAKDGGIINLGCSASVQKVLRRYDDGRMDLMALGQKRFRILDINEERQYLRGEVEFFDDLDMKDVPPEVTVRAKAALEQLQSMEDMDALQSAIPTARLSFQIACLLDDIDKRQMVLALRSERERLEFLIKAVPEYMNRQQRIAIAKRVAPLNGHAKKPTGTGE